MTGERFTIGLIFLGVGIAALADASGGDRAWWFAALGGWLLRAALAVWERP